MKKVIARFLVIEAAALTIAALLNFFNHNSYWKKTIFRTQTVDFNILSHILHTKLSYALQKNDVEALQQTLNSNYELFGLVVTDCKIKERYCPKEEIQYLSKSEQKPRPWRKYLKAKNLQNYPYNLLQNPPPLYAEWQYDNPHSKDNERQANKKLNEGEIIGRVYYVRGVPPTYLDDIKKFIQNPVKDSGGSRVYLLTVALCLLAGFSFWTVTELVLYRKNTREKQLALENDKLLTLKANKLLKAENESTKQKNDLLEAERQLDKQKNDLLEAENESTKQKNDLLEAERQLDKQKNDLLEAENESTKQKNDLLEAERQLDKQKNDLLEAENKIARTRGFIGGIQEVIEQDFSSVISNRLQELKGIFGRLNTDIDNIAHDMRKAPLIKPVEDFPNKRVEKFTKLPLSETEKNSILQDIIQYVQDADQTIKVISWVVNDLDEVAKLESKPVCVQDELKNFNENLPPNLRKNWLTINFVASCEEPLWINCNPWHLRSIVKNSIYNSSASLIKLRLTQGSTFKGNISVSCVRVGNEAGILIEDNGTGFSEQALKKLYQFVDKKVDENAEITKGKGSTIVFSYLSLHGGRVELANAVEKGARALFLFPLICSPSLNK